MKRLNVIFCIIVCIVSALSSQGQNATDYLFTSVAGSYTEITGGTVLGSTTSDDQVFNNNTTGQTPPITNTGFPIGFNFVYRGITYDKFAVNNNGWIVLGTGSFQIAASSGNYTPLSTTGPAGYVNAISALGRDLQAQTGSELSYKTEGTAPNRYLVVQWKGYRKYAATGDNFNFQIRLFETTNEIKFIYGSMTVNATSSTPQVGIRGATVGDFHNRTTTTNWSATTKGALASNTCTLSSTVKPPTGLTYTFYLLSPGSISGNVNDFNGSPISGATVAIQGGISTTTDGSGYYMLSPVQPGNYTVNCSAVGYNPASVSVTVLSGTNTNQSFTLNNPEIEVEPAIISRILDPGQSASATIEVINEGNGPLNWTAVPGDPPPAGYCANASTICDEFISQVTYGSINKTSGCEKYANFTAYSTNVVPGSSATITVKVGPPSYTGDAVRVWVDWNRNAQFDETPVQLTGTLPNLSGTITVPANAQAGATRMRLYLTYNLTPAPGPCTPPSNGWGEVEDYTVVILPTWLSLNLYSGTVPAGGTGTTTALMNATGLNPGVFSLPITFISDPSVGTRTTQVQLTVTDTNLAGPVNLNIDAINTSEGKLRLKWEYWADATIDHFMIMRNGEPAGNTKKMQYVDTVEEGAYCYQVYAVYDNGLLSSPSNEICLNFPLDPRIPLSGWALVLTAGLIAGWTFLLIRKRS